MADGTSRSAACLPARCVSGDFRAAYPLATVQSRAARKRASAIESERKRASQAGKQRGPSTIDHLPTRPSLQDSTMASLAVPSILRSSARRAAQVSTVNRFRTRDLDGPVVHVDTALKRPGFVQTLDLMTIAVCPGA